jgi:hypothetical protein
MCLRGFAMATVNPWKSHIRVDYNKDQLPAIYA